MFAYVGGNPVNWGDPLGLITLYEDLNEYGFIDDLFKGGKNSVEQHLFMQYSKETEVEYNMLNRRYAMEYYWRKFATYVREAVKDRRKDLCGEVYDGLYGINIPNILSNLPGWRGLIGSAYSDNGTVDSAKELIDMYSAEAFHLQQLGPQIIIKENWEKVFGSYTPNLHP